RDLLSSHQSVTQANSRSFDSADGLASEPTCFAQDDRGLGLQHGAAEGAPFQSDLEIFRAFVRAGQRLAEIHIHYEQQPEYPLTKTEKAGERLDWRVTKMRLSKDKTSLTISLFLTSRRCAPEKNVPLGHANTSITTTCRHQPAPAEQFSSHCLPS